MPEAGLPGLVAELVAVRHAGGYRFKIPERVLRQFADYCRREGYPDGSITKEAVKAGPGELRRERRKPWIRRIWIEMHIARIGRQLQSW